MKTNLKCPMCAGELEEEKDLFGSNFHLKCVKCGKAYRLYQKGKNAKEA